MAEKHCVSRIICSHRASSHAPEFSQGRECLQRLLIRRKASLGHSPVQNLHLGFEVCNENFAFALKYYLWMFS